jgi:deazaflavin-dependent oxidoreductase (nitroreductase family)
VDDAVRASLDHSQAIDITTTGAKTGRQRRLEIVLHNFGRHLYLSGIPNAARKRGWLANLEANPALTVHLKRPVQADLPATGRVIRDPVERKAVLEQVARVWNRRDVNVMLEHSPLIEISIEGYPA